MTFQLIVVVVVLPKWDRGLVGPWGGAAYNSNPKVCSTPPKITLGWAVGAGTLQGATKLDVAACSQMVSLPQPMVPSARVRSED